MYSLSAVPEGQSPTSDRSVHPDTVGAGKAPGTSSDRQTYSSPATGAVKVVALMLKVMVLVPAGKLGHEILQVVIGRRTTQQHGPRSYLIPISPSLRRGEHQGRRP